MKKGRKNGKCWIALLLLVTMVMGVVTGCGNGKESTSADGKTTITFWATGTEERINALTTQVNKFNESQEKIFVDFQVRPDNGYADALQNILSFSSAPDVFLYDDRYLKTWSIMDVLEPLDEYVKSDEDLALDDMWTTLVQRFRYDTKNYISEEDSPLYALPCGNIPTVVYYNKTALETAGIKVISKDYSDDLPEEEKHGFYHSGTQGQMPQAGETMVFNDRIAMTWEEMKDLAMYLNKDYNADSPTTYGYYSHWWFNFGWSVGGDAIQYDETSKKWKFSLGDKTRHVNEDGVELPSMYEALEFYLSLIQKEELGGLGLMPTQAEVDVLGDDVYFLSEGVALLVGKANLISVFNERSTFEYGIAPIPKHKDGIEASSSEAQGLSIWKNSKHKEEAYEFISYLASEEAQKEMAREGVYVPNQKTAAYEVYREENQIVENAILLAEVSEYQRPGDWTYMPDDAWLDEWTSYFNNQVRNSEMTLDEFFETVTDKVNLALERVISLD